MFESVHDVIDDGVISAQTFYYIMYIHGTIFPLLGCKIKLQ